MEDKLWNEGLSNQLQMSKITTLQDMVAGVQEIRDDGNRNYGVIRTKVSNYKHYGLLEPLKERCGNIVNKMLKGNTMKVPIIVYTVH